MALIQAKGRLESAFNGWLSSGVTTTANGALTPQMLLGARRNMVSGFTDQKSAIPDGHLAYSAYFIPQVAGNMSSINEANIVFAATGNAAQGINLTGSTAITFAAAGDGAAVAAAIGSSTITFAASGTAVAPLNATGTATITFAATGTIRADAASDSSGNGGSVSIDDVKVIDVGTGPVHAAGTVLYLKAECEATVSDGIMLPGCKLLADVTATTAGGTNHTFTTTSATGYLYLELGRWTDNGFYPAEAGNKMASGCIGNFTLS